jgi:hypothetical protein
MSKQCNCNSVFLDKVKEHIKAKAPNGSERLDISMPQVRFAFTDKGLKDLVVMDVKGEYFTPKKAGGFKRVKVDTFISANYCPFCGVSLKDADNATNL